MTHTDQLQWVEWLLERGMHLHPLDHPALPECIGRHGPKNPCDGKRGKHPVVRWRREATNDPAVLRRWFTAGPRNIGISCGPSRLIVVDEDRPGALADYAAEIGQTVPPTLTIGTGRGHHYYFRAPEGVALGNAVGDLRGRGIDVRGEGGYVVGPGSLHETGVLYLPVDPDAPILPAPAWLVEALTPKPPAERLPLDRPARPTGDTRLQKAHTPELAAALARRTGDRSADIAAVWGAAYRSGWTVDEIVDLVIREQHPICGKWGADRIREDAQRFYAKADPPYRLQGHDPRDPSDLVGGTAGGGMAGEHSGGGETGETGEPPSPYSPRTGKRGKGKGPTQADILLALAADRYTLGRTPAGEPYAVPRRGPYIARMLRGGQHSLRAELAAAFHAATGRAASSSALADAMLAIEGQAMTGPATELHLRTAPDGNGGILVDLGHEDGATAHITPGGWEIVYPRSGPLFRRTEVTGPLPMPERGGDVEMLRGLVNVADEHWPLLLGWLVAAYVPDIPHPVALLVGEQGTAKTTTGRMLVDLVDPSAAPLRAMPRDEQSWAVAAAASWVVGIDNVSGIAPWLSDAMCRAVTGEAWVSRRLYTDTELSVLQFRRVLLLTSIDTGSLRGDLADRMLTIELHPIPDHQRRTDRQVAQDYAAARPTVLGGLFDLVAKVLAALPAARKRLTERPRMADFAEILAALDDVLGTNALATYLADRDQVAADLIEGDPVASAVRDIVRERGGWRGEVARLFELVEGKAPATKPGWWPKTPGAFSGYLNRAAPALRKVGISLERKRVNGRRVVEFVIKGDALARESVTLNPESVTLEGGSVTQTVTLSAASRPAKTGEMSGLGDAGDALDPLSSVEKKKRGESTGRCAPRTHTQREKAEKSVTCVTPGRANLSNGDESGGQDRRAGRNTTDAPEGGEPVRDAVRRSSENRRSDLPGTIRGQGGQGESLHLFGTCARNGCRNPVPNRYGTDGSPLCPACREGSA